MRLTQHRSDQADPERRGLAYGRALAGEIGRAVTAYAGFFRAFEVSDAQVRRMAEEVGSALAEWDPAARAELAGVAAGAGVDPLAVLALNARTEVLAGGVLPGECSTVVTLGDGPPGTLQTWDWYPELTPVGVLYAHPSATGGVKTFTEPGMLAKIGVNAAGLGLHFNILHHRADGPGGVRAERGRPVRGPGVPGRGAVGVPVHLVAARVLREADSVGSAIHLARSAPLSASTVLTVVSWRNGVGEAACLELSPAGVGVVRPDPDGFLWHTNHFRDPVLATGENALATGTTWARGDHLVGQRSALLAGGSSTDRASAFAGPAGPAAVVHARCRPGDPLIDRYATLLTASLDLQRHALEVAPGGPAGFGTRACRF